MSDTVVIKCKKPPVVELDSAACAAYVRFTRKKVAKTKLVTSKGCVVTMDLDANGEVIGVELVGVRQFGIVELLEKARIKPPPKRLLEKTAYVPAAA